MLQHAGLLVRCTKFSSVLGSSFLGGFLFGLPVAFFDIVLLWQPWGTIERRVSKRPELPRSHILSWSWMGWKGGIDVISDYYKIYMITFMSLDAITTPIVQWFCYESKEGNSKRWLVAQNWYDFLEKYFGEGKVISL
jgi:hypothetical protein